MRNSWPALPAAAVALLALGNLPAQVRTALETWRASPKGIARSADAARRELRGDAYEDVVARARALVPSSGAYAVADDGGEGPDKNWVRCDLAPRTPVFLRPGHCGDWYFDRPAREVPEFAVVVQRDGSVRLEKTKDLLGTLWQGLEGPESDVPGWMDEPAEGARVASASMFGGWCQEKGGRPCRAVRVWVDGLEVDAARVERFARPDVCAAVPGLDDCSRAGWRVAFRAGELAAGSHCVAAALIAGDGRHRRVGPWTFAVGR